MDAKQRTEIYDCLLGHCAEYEFAGRWSFVTAERTYYCPSAPDALAELLQRFQPAALIEAGIACPDGGAVNLRPELLAPDDPLLALEANRDPFALLTTTACLGVDAPPALACLDDQFTIRAAEETDRQLLVTFSMIDAALLRELGLPAIPATQLDTLTPSMAERLIDRLGWRSPAMSEGSAYPSPATLKLQVPASEAHTTGTEQVACDHAGGRNRFSELLFVGWSVENVSLDMPQELPKVAKYLRKLCGYLGIDFIAAPVWHPSEAELERIEFFVGHRETGWLRTAFRESLGMSVKTLDSYAAEPSGRVVPAAGIAETLAELQRLAHDGGQHDSYRRRKIWQTFEQQLHETVVAPLVDDAMRSGDPSSRTLQMAAAQLSRVFHGMAASVSVKMSMALAQQGDQLAEAIPAEQIKDLLSVADRLLKTTQEIERCQPSPKIKVIEAQPAPVIKPALPRYA